MLGWQDACANGGGSMEIAGWGRQGVEGQELFSEHLLPLGATGALSRGLGRSYGDSSLPPSSNPIAINTTFADRLIRFDSESGELHAEAGFRLLDLNRIFWPRGWTTPVSPGTQYVTLGGMVASDVHGKNHHVEGCFGNHVLALRMLPGSGEATWCSRTEHPDLFWATAGGMGLTGHILEVKLQLKPIASAWIWGESERIDNLDAFLRGLDEAATSWPYTVGWIDALAKGHRTGRGILYKGRWAQPEEAPARLPKPRARLSVPVECPSWVMGRAVVRGFNFLYFWKHLKRKRVGIVHPESFFYPLDVALHWNRLYGRQGVVQYQCVLPKAAGADGVRRMLQVLSQRGGASFLCVLKDCGPEGQGLLSFPMQGTSIALDLPLRPQTQELVDALNEQLLREGGRIYLTKDALTRPHHFRQMESRLADWQSVRHRWDPERRFGSAQAERLLDASPSPPPNNAAMSQRFTRGGNQ